MFQNNRQQHLFWLEPPVCWIFHPYSLSVSWPCVSWAVLYWQFYDQYPRMLMHAHAISTRLFFPSSRGIGMRLMVDVHTSPNPLLWVWSRGCPARLLHLPVLAFPDIVHCASILWCLTLSLSLSHAQTYYHIHFSLRQGAEVLVSMYVFQYTILVFKTMLKRNFFFGYR